MSSQADLVRSRYRALKENLSYDQAVAALSEIRQDSTLTAQYHFSISPERVLVEGGSTQKYAVDENKWCLMGYLKQQD